MRGAVDERSEGAAAWEASAAWETESEGDLVDTLGARPSEVDDAVETMEQYVVRACDAGRGVPVPRPEEQRPEGAATGGWQNF
mmetsp:Transcript_17104/g.35110  ORF Transcript_17104/g.35110 Transcript_17104/m.35110 type:complete len:83 (+) Transcript_17104:260-508(+)